MPIGDKPLTESAIKENKQHDEEAIFAVAIEPSSPEKSATNQKDVTETMYSAPQT